MNEKVENLILEHLRSMRSDMTRMSDRVDTIAAEILIIRQHMAGLLGSQNLHDHEMQH